ncbi:hypothetical protein BHE74_00040435 [Ensete ventricosum]|nr:hypothetical protein BHE74_00040435 [Ensete ventricosum]
MAAKRFESDDSSDNGGRRGQQQRRLRLCGCKWRRLQQGCGCNRRKMGSGVHGCCGGGQQRYGVRDGCCHVQFVARRDQNKDDSKLMDLQLGGQRWMKATSKAIVGIAWKMEAAEMATGQQERGSDTR